jgi:hypothetical protein
VRIRVMKAAPPYLYNGGAWFNSHIGETFEVVRVMRDKWMQIYEVDTSALNIGSDTGYVDISLAEVVDELPICRTMRLEDLQEIPSTDLFDIDDEAVRQLISDIHKQLDSLLKQYAEKTSTPARCEFRLSLPDVGAGGYCYTGKVDQ